MSKRKRGDGSLTGGLGDVNPALLSAKIVQTGTDTTTSYTIQTPVTVVAGRGNSDVMEIIKVFWYNLQAPLPVAGATTRITGYLSTKNFTTTEPALKQADALVFASADWQSTVIQVTAAGEESIAQYNPTVIDLSDGAGHGFLVATSNIYLQCVSASTTKANEIYVKILYRLKKVSESQLTSLLLSQNQG